VRRTASLRARALDVVKSWIPVSCGVLDVVTNERLDLINGLLYTLPQSLSVDVLQIPYRNWLSVLGMRPLDESIGILSGHPSEPDFGDP